MKYVGLTTTSINLRINNHMASIKNQKNFAVSTHFQRHRVQNIEFSILEERNDATNDDLRIMEAYWINRFNTFEKGLNTKNEVDININNHLLTASRHYQHDQTCFPYLMHRIHETKQDQLK